MCFFKNFVLEKPSKPRGPVKITDIQKTAMTLNWKHPEDDGGSPLIGYLLEFKEINRQYWSKIEQVPASITSYTVQNLRQGAEYEYRISAVNKIGQSESLLSEGACMAKSPFSKSYAIFTFR